MGPHHLRRCCKSSQDGFSVVEAILAFLILTIIMGAATSMIVSSIQGNSKSKTRLAQATVAEAVWERLQSDSSWTLQTTPTDCRTSLCVVAPSLYEDAVASAAGGRDLKVTVTSKPQTDAGGKTLFNVGVTVAASITGVPELTVGGIYDPANADASELTDVAGNDMLAQRQFVVEFAGGGDAAHKAAAVLAAGPEAKVVSDLAVGDSYFVTIDVPEDQLAAAQARVRDLAGYRGVARETIAEMDTTTPVTVSGPTVDDERYAEQWAVDTMHLQEAWRRSDPAARGALVAVVDSGVDYSHPDLAGKVVGGTDFMTRDGDPMDSETHGTHVAGIIAANANNGIGIAGVAPRAGILAQRSCGLMIEVYAAAPPGARGCPASRTAEAVVDAVDRGANVINISLGFLSESPVLKASIEYAASKGVVVVCSAGNNSTSVPQFPASWPECISVGATESLDTLAVYSNFGDTVDVTAPGSAIMSTVSAHAYKTMSGTSMAAPQVAGLAALLYEEGLDAAAIRDVITRTTDDLGAPGFDPAFAHGRINAGKALAMAQPHSETAVTRFRRETSNSHYLGMYPAHVKRAGQYGYTKYRRLGFAHPVQALGTRPLLSFYDRTYRQHHYSVHPRVPEGYTYQGISGYVYKDYVAGTTAVYRMHNAKTHERVFTVSTREAYRLMEAGWRPANGGTPVFYVIDYGKHVNKPLMYPPDYTGPMTTGL